MAIFESKKSSNDIVNNGTMSDDEVVASDVPPRYLFVCKEWEEEMLFFPKRFLRKKSPPYF